jgi:hypothetical protein
MFRRRSREIPLDKSEIQKLVEFAIDTVGQDWPHGAHPAIKVQARLQQACLHLNDQENERVAQIYLAALKGKKRVQDAVNELDRLLNTSDERKV